MENSHSILLVDDDPDIRHILTLLLEHGGFTVMQAADGVDALAQAKELPPDGVISDVQMPNMDGLELAHELRALPRGADIPIVLFTGQPPHPELQRVLDLEHLHYMSKGDPREIIDALHTLLDRNPTGASPA
jgi:two-component system phosphate regulon response regulator PhoB